MELIKFFKSSLALVLTLTLLTGCGSNNNKTPTSSTSANLNSSSRDLSQEAKDELNQCFTNLQNAFKDYETYLKQLNTDKEKIKNKDSLESIKDFENLHTKFHNISLAYNQCPKQINTDEKKLQSKYQSIHQNLDKIIKKVGNLLLINLDNLSNKYNKKKNKEIENIQEFLNKNLPREEEKDGLWGDTIIENLFIYINNSATPLKENILNLDPSQFIKPTNPKPPLENNLNTSFLVIFYLLTLISLGCNGILWLKYRNLKRKNEELNNNFEDFKKETSAIIVAKIEHIIENSKTSKSSTSSTSRATPQQTKSSQIGVDSLPSDLDEMGNNSVHGDDSLLRNTTSQPQNLPDDYLNKYNTKESNQYQENDGTLEVSTSSDTDTSTSQSVQNPTDVEESGIETQGISPSDSNELNKVIKIYCNNNQKFQRETTYEHNIIEVIETDESIQSQMTERKSEKITLKNTEHNQGDHYIFRVKKTGNLWFFPKKITNEQQQLIQKLFLPKKETFKPAQISSNIEYENFMKEGFVWEIEIRQQGER